MKKIKNIVKDGRQLKDRFATDCGGGELVEEARKRKD